VARALEPVGHMEKHWPFRLSKLSGHMALDCVRAKMTLAMMGPTSFKKFESPAQKNGLELAGNTE